jgi:membrane-bound serine protease (ClpP class)
MRKILIFLLIGYIVFEIIEHVVFPLFWLIINRRKKSMSGVNGMLGQIGEVKEWSETNGKIFIHGELWNAISEVPLYPGDKAIIQAVDGLVLKVKPIGNSGQD